MVKDKVSKYEVTRLGFDPWMGVWDRGADRKTKSKIKYNKNQKKSKCINYVILDSVFGCEFDFDSDLT